MEKLSYILKLCDYIINLSKSRTSPFYLPKYVNSNLQNTRQTSPIPSSTPASSLTTPGAIPISSTTTTVANTSQPFNTPTINSINKKSLDQFTVADEAMKKAEQLILYF